MSKEEHGAKGKMSLYFYFKESPSGHIEDGKAIELQAKDKDIIQLIKHDWHMEMFKGHRDEDNKIIYEISTNNLIKLIEEHGERK